MKIKILIAILVFLIVVNLGTIGSYIYFQVFEDKQERFYPRRDRPPFHRPDFNLTGEQREEMAKLLSELRRETRPLRLRLYELEKKTLQLLQRDPIPEQRIEENLESISEIRLQMSRLSIQKMIEATSILPPEQQQHFFNSLMRVGPSMKERFWKHSGKPAAEIFMPDKFIF